MVTVRADKRLLIVPALFFLSPFVTAAIPRLTWLFLALIAIALGVRAWRQGVAWRTLVPLDAVSIAAFLVAAYASINALWAADPGAGFAKAALLWGLILVTIAAATAITALDERQLRLGALGRQLGVEFIKTHSPAARFRARTNPPRRLACPASSSCDRSGLRPCSA